MSNRFFIGLLVTIAVIFGGFVIFGKDNGGSGSSNAQPTNHVKGEGSSGVTLTEYGDFQCSACFQYEPVVKAIYEKYQSQITFQFRHFPITAKHPNAFAAARAAEAAGKQGKFWEMHDLLYQNAYQQTDQGLVPTAWANTSSPTSFFESYAEQLSLNLEQFKSDFTSEAVNDFINADIEAAQQVPVDGTPTFQINGEKINTPTSFEEFSKLIDEAIKQKTGGP